VASFLVTGFLFSIFGHFTFTTPAVPNEKIPLLSSQNTQHKDDEENRPKQSNEGKIIFLFVMWVLHVTLYSALAMIILQLSPWEEYNLLIVFLPSEFGFMFISFLVVWCYVKCQATPILSSKQGLLIRQALDYDVFTPLDLPIANNLHSLSNCTKEVKNLESLPGMEELPQIISKCVKFVEENLTVVDPQFNYDDLFAIALYTCDLNQGSPEKNFYF